jgi:indole-3-glycerol phosphate synthase
MSTTSILAQIVAHKQVETERQQRKVPLAELFARLPRALPPRGFRAALAARTPQTALIAEVKKASPSRGVLLEHFDHLAIARTYAAAGAAALSVLTDVRFFQGSLSYLSGIRRLPEIADGGIPLLRKDFIIDTYQIVEARVAGADAILLIAAILSDEQLQQYSREAAELGMDVLLEVHTAEEMQRALAVGAPLIGINNRDLHRFVTDLAVTRELAALLPTGPDRPLLVSESGIFTLEHVATVRGYGAGAVLVGESLITAPDIGAAAAALVNA